MLSDTALRPGTKKTRPRCVFVLTLVLSACGTTASIEDETLDAGESGQSDGGVDAPPADPIDRQGVDASGDATLTSIVEGGSAAPRSAYRRYVAGNQLTHGRC